MYGGTSAASPQLAALTASAEQERTAAGKGPLGNIVLLVYEHSAWFRDVGPVVQGTAASGRLVNNQLWQSNADGSVPPGPVPGWPTLGGYDMTTGLGTPWAPSYVTGLVCRAITNRLDPGPGPTRDRGRGSRTRGCLDHLY